MFDTIELGQVQVNVEANVPYIRQPISGVTRIDLPGVSLAYRQTIGATSSVDSAHDRTTVCVGDWQNFGTDKYVTYRFVRAPLTPYIENACINLQGLPETVDAVVKEIDWKPLLAALTK